MCNKKQSERNMSNSNNCFYKLSNITHVKSITNVSCFAQKLPEICAQCLLVLTIKDKAHGGGSGGNWNGV